MIVAIAMIAIAGFALALFISAGTWANSDQIASTLGFFLGLAGLGLGAITLLMQIEAGRQTAGQQQPQPRDANNVTASPNKDNQETSPPQRRGLRLRWRIRLGAPAAAAGGGGCLMDGALGATVVSSIAAVILTVPQFGSTGENADVTTSPSVRPNVTVPRTPPESTDPTTTTSQTITDKLMSLQVDVSPATVGNNSLHLYAYTPDKKPLPVVEWTATAALPAEGIEPIEVPLLRITDFHAIGDIALPAAGEWTFAFTVRTSDIDQSTLTVTAKIS
jgi:hypothetical protein